MNVNDCPMCGEAPAKNDSICQECEDYINEGNDQQTEQTREYYHNIPTVEEQHYELYVKRFGEDHPETIRIGASLGLL